MADTEETYLADGVYASLEAGMIKLRVDRDEGCHFIYLEPETYVALRRYARELGWEAQSMEPPQ